MADKLIIIAGIYSSLPNQRRNPIVLFAVTSKKPSGIIESGILQTERGK
jgi:hypothetical protein